MAEAITSRLAVTLSLVIGATVLTAVVAVVLGVVAATRRGWADRVVQVLAVLGFADPGLPHRGSVWSWSSRSTWAGSSRPATPSSPSHRDGWLSSITLPVIALSLGGIAGVAAQIRGSMIDALRLDYVRTLRSRGLSERRVVYKHVLRNAAGPALSVLAIQFVGLLGGAVIVEQIFAIPGLGRSRSGPPPRATSRWSWGWSSSWPSSSSSLNLVVDLLQGWLNPKVRLS